MALVERLPFDSDNGLTTTGHWGHSKTGQHYNGVPHEQLADTDAGSIHCAFLPFLSMYAI